MAERFFVQETMVPAEVPNSAKRSPPLDGVVAAHRSNASLPRAALNGSGTAVPPVKGGPPLALGLPPRPGHVAEVDARERTRQQSPLPPSITTAKKLVDETWSAKGDHISLAAINRGRSSLAHATTVASSSKHTAHDDAPVLKLPSRLLSRPKGITMSTQTSDADCELPTIPPPTSFDHPTDKHRSISSTRAWSWAGEREALAAGGGRARDGSDDGTATTITTIITTTTTTTTTTAPPEETDSSPATPVTTIEVAPTVTVEDELVMTPDAPEGTMSLASAISAVDEREAALARTSSRPVVAKPWGYPLESPTTRLEKAAKEESVCDRKDSSDDLLSISSAEQKFNLLRRLWKRSSAGKRAGEQGALSTRTAGPTSFAGPEKPPTVKKEEKRKDERRDKEETTPPVLIVRGEPAVPLAPKAGFKVGAPHAPRSPLSRAVYFLTVDAASCWPRCPFW